MTRHTPRLLLLCTFLLCGACKDSRRADGVVLNNDPGDPATNPDPATTPDKKDMASAPDASPSPPPTLDLKLVANPARPAPFDTIEMPAGFDIDYFAKNIDGARSMVRSPSGVLFVGTRRTGKLFALVDADQDGRAETTHLLSDSLDTPNGVALKDGNLYVAEVGRILRFDDIESRLTNPPAPVVVTDDYPDDAHHGWKFIAFGPDGKLYVPVGAPCNVCERDEEIYSTITRIDPDGSNREIVAHGVRNSVGFTWHPVTKELWFTDNGRDRLGDDIPPDELNRVQKDGAHFGFPYCHGGDLLDPDFGDGKSCANYVAPVRQLGPHVAALGMRFYTGGQFPAGFKHQAFIAEHGSWNRTTPIGYRVSLVTLNEAGESQGYHVFAKGWLKPDGTPWGRPVDVLELPDGSMLVSDDFHDAIYRITYKP